MLAHAVYKHNAQVAKLLLQAKVDPNVQNRRGETALHIAYEVSEQSMVKLLLKHGAKKKIQNNNGLTPPQIGKKRESQMTAQQLAKRNAKKQVLFNTELSAACSDGDLTAVYDIVMTGAPVNAQNKSGSTVLMDAVWNGHLDVVMALIDLKADPAITNYRMNSALHFAYMKEHMKIVEFLEGQEDLTHTRNALGQKPKHLTGTSSTRSIRSDSTRNIKTYVNPVVQIQANYRGRNTRRKFGRKK